MNPSNGELILLFGWSNLTILLLLIYNYLFKKYTEDDNKEYVKVKYDDYLELKVRLLELEQKVGTPVKQEPIEFIQKGSKIDEYLNCLGKDHFDNQILFDFNPIKAGSSVYNYTNKSLSELSPKQLNECFMKIMKYEEDHIFTELGIPECFIYTINNENTDIEGMKKYILSLSKNSKSNFINNDIGSLFGEVMKNIIPVVNTSVNPSIKIEEQSTEQKPKELNALELEMKHLLED